MFLIPSSPDEVDIFILLTSIAMHTLHTWRKNSTQFQSKLSSLWKVYSVVRISYILERTRNQWSLKEKSCLWPSGDMLGLPLGSWRNNSFYLQVQLKLSMQTIIRNTSIKNILLVTKQPFRMPNLFQLSTETTKIIFSTEITKKSSFSAQTTNHF